MSAWIDADWPAPPGVRALTTTRYGMGVSQPPFDSLDLGLRNGDDVAAVAENRMQIESALRLPSSPRWLRQVHGTSVAIEPGEDEPEADAAVTSVPGTVLAVLTADCLPVAFAAKDGGEIAVAHAGWRGLAAGVLEATIAAMKAPPRDIVAWLGPAAGPDAYEIGEEVFDAFAAIDPRTATAFVPTRPGHWHVDLHALAKRRLADVGIADVHGGGLCTISDPTRFFSHRRSTTDGSGRSGRMATLAWMR
ncbi:peptidoglycan editing factor PgeF [Pseudoluteimonas lycopersici]|uniref:Purine nucleoside phosphorylase n=1 Tax=Pseudoluteimonas lycopersici TaxID=1324796 RepID=A0A516V7N9_9GAMM|nr:peptidoglycan editing factor PgeF [Lysobacter lycopersici]QDQ74533.1 peptidoglycan editing factor PgeF [Lysobacter lycopersici]